MKMATTTSVGGTLFVLIQHCVQDLLTNTLEKKYGPRKERNGKYVHSGDSVGVVMDKAKGELSFAVNGVNYGVA